MATEVVEDGVLKSVVLDEGETSYATSPAVRIVGARAIGADFAAGTVTLSDECEEVRDFAFFNNGHIRTLNIGRGLRTISSHSFAYRNALEKIEVAADNDTFASVGGCLCDKAGETVHLGVNAEVMELPATCRAVDENAFAYCGGIRTLRLNSALVSIGAYAFCDCSGIENVYVSANVMEIGKGAFCGCGGVNTITVDGSRNAGGTNIVDLLKVAFADIGKVSQVKITGRVGKIALLLGDGTFANTDIDTLVDTGSRPADEWPYAKKYRNEDQTVTATFRYADPSDPSQVTEQQVTVSPGMPFGAIPLPGQFVGFTFDGWFYENQAEFGKQPITRDSIVKPMGDFTVVAKYVVEECLVRFYDSDGTTVLEEYTVEYGDTVTTPPSPAFDPDEYTFKGWLLEGTTDHYPAGETIIVRSNMDFVARIVPIGLFDYEVVSTPTSTSVSVFGFNPYWSDDEITSELATSAGIYQLAIPDTMRVRVSGSMKTVKVRTVGYEPIYYDGVQIEPSDPHATKPDGTPLKPFGYFGSRIIFKDVTLGTNVTKVNDYAFKGFRSGKLILPYALARIGNYAFDGDNGCEVRMEGHADDAMNPVGENFVKVGEYAFWGIASAIYYGTWQKNKRYYAGDIFGFYNDNGIYLLYRAIEDFQYGNFTDVLSNGVVEEYARLYLKLAKNNVSIGKYAFERAHIDKLEAHTAEGYGLSVTSVPEGCFASNDEMLYAEGYTYPINTSSVGAYAFYQCSNIREMPVRGATRIGAWAFYGCGNLTDITHLTEVIQGQPAISSIGDWAFYAIGTQGEGFPLSSQRFNDAVIGTGAFSQAKITSLFISPSLIKSYAFSECTYLETISIGGANSNPMTVASYAFSYCGTMLHTVRFDACDSIGRYAFSGAFSIYYIEVNGGSSYRCNIGDSAFRESMQTGRSPLGVSLRLYRCGSVGGNAFRECYAMEWAEIDVTSIGDAAFYGNVALRELSMNTDVVRDIGANAFNTYSGEGAQPMDPNLFWHPDAWGADGKVFGLALVSSHSNPIPTDYTWLVHSRYAAAVLNLDSSSSHEGVPAADSGKFIAGIAQKTFRARETGGIQTVYLPAYGYDVYAEGSSEKRLKPRLCIYSFSGFSSLEVYMPSPCSFAAGAFDVWDLTIHTNTAAREECEFPAGGESTICTGHITWDVS